MLKKQRLTYQEAEWLLNTIEYGRIDQWGSFQDVLAHLHLLREFWKPHPTLRRLEELEPTFWANAKLIKKGLIDTSHPPKMSPKSADIPRLLSKNTGFAFTQRTFFLSLTKRDLNTLIYYDTEEDASLVFGHRSLAGRFVLRGNIADLIDYVTEGWVKKSKNAPPNISISTTLNAIMAVLLRKDLEPNAQLPPAVDKLLADLAELGEGGVYYLKGLIPTRSLMFENWSAHRSGHTDKYITYIRGVYGWLFHYNGDGDAVGTLSIAPYPQARQEICKLLDIPKRT